MTTETKKSANSEKANGLHLDLHCATPKIVKSFDELEGYLDEYKFLEKFRNKEFPRIIVWTQAQIYRGKPANPESGKRIKFYGSDPRDEYLMGEAVTDSEGKAIFPLNFNHRHEGEPVLIRAQIEGTAKVEKIEIPLIPDFGKGREREFRFLRYNAKKNAKKICFYGIQTFMLALISYMALSSINEGKSASLIIGVFLALIIHYLGRKVPGIIKWALIPIGISYFWPNLLIRPFILSIIVICVSFIAYLAEELTYRVVVTDAMSSKPSLKWEKMKNFYPYWPMRLLLFPIVWNLLQAATTLLTIGSFDLNFQDGHIISISEGPGVAEYLYRSFCWLFSALALFAYALPGEIFGMFTKSRGAGETVGWFVILKGLIDEMKNLFFLGTKAAK